MIIILLPSSWWIFYACCFLRDIHDGHLTLKHSVDEKSNFTAKIKNLDKGKKTVEKGFFKKTHDYYLVQEKMFLITLKTDYFEWKN